MKLITCVGLSEVLMINLEQFAFMENLVKYGTFMHHKLVEKLLHASVNNFYDVSPIGKIITIYSADQLAVSVFLFNPIRRLMDAIAPSIVVISLFFMIANFFTVLVCLALIIYIIRLISLPYTYFDNQLWMLRFRLENRQFSSVHEMLRG